MMNLHVGIIGLGKIGHSFGVSPQGEPLSHSQAYARLPNVTVVLGVDPDAYARNDFQDCFPQARVYDSIANVPNELQLDLVSVCSPTAYHAVGVTKALSWGCRVILCEKPLAANVAEAKTIISASVASDCILMTNYSRRWTPMLEALKSIIQTEGKIGTPLGACLRYNGGLQHNGTHWIDLLLALFGPVAKVDSLEKSLTLDADAAESIALHWDSGLTAYLIAVRGDRFSIGEGEIWGSGGLVRYSGGGKQVTLQTVKESEWLGFKELGELEIICESGLNGHLMNAASEAVKLAQIGGKPSCSGADGLGALQVVEMAINYRLRS